MAKISTKNIAQAIYASTKGKAGADLHQAIDQVVKFLARKHLLARSNDILNYLSRVVDDDENLLRVRVLSAKKLTEHALEEIKTTLKKRYKVEKIILEEKEDTELIGGIRIEVKDEVIDLSLKNKINQLQAYLLKN